MFPYWHLQAMFYELYTTQWPLGLAAVINCFPSAGLLKHSPYISSVSRAAKLSPRSTDSTASSLCSLLVFKSLLRSRWCCLCNYVIHFRYQQNVWGTWCCLETAWIYNRGQRDGRLMPRHLSDFFPRFGCAVKYFVQSSTFRSALNVNCRCTRRILSPTLPHEL